MKLLFAGTPDFSARILQSLIESGHEPSLILTQPDRPQGRGRRIVPSPVKNLAKAHGINLMQPETLSTRRAAGQLVLREIMSYEWDLMIVAAYGLMIPVPLLEHPRHGAINVHASLLPRWRGASPVEYAVMAGDTQTGVTLMQMDEGLDTGDIIAALPTPISRNETGPELTARLAELGAQLLATTLPDLVALPRKPQNSAEATYAPKLTEDVARIDWTRTSNQLHDQVRALTGRLPACSTLAGLTAEVRVKILAGEPVFPVVEGRPGEIVAHKRADLIVVATGSGNLGISSLQLSIGKGTPLDARSARNGFRDLLAPGKLFLSPRLPASSGLQLK